MPKPLRFCDRLDRYRPVLVRLFARRSNGLPGFPTDQEILANGNLPLSEIKRLSYATTWDGVPIDVVYGFLAACNVDLEDRTQFNKLEQLRRRGVFARLRTSPLFETQIREMLDNWVESSS